MNKTTSFFIELSIIIAILVVLLVLPPCYLKKSNERLNKTVERLIEETYLEKFSTAEKTITELKNVWEKEKGLRALVLEEKYVMDADNSMSQCKAAIETQNRVLAYEYANSIKQILEESYFSISFKFWNIF